MTSERPVKGTPEYEVWLERNREYQRKWFADNREVQRERVAANSAKATERNRQLVLEHLLANPCVDCGEDDIVVLEFDHVRGKKSANVALLYKLGVKRLLAEIAKCEVVCANCHRRRTATRAGWWRTMVR